MAGPYCRPPGNPGAGPSPARSPCVHRSAARVRSWNGAVSSHPLDGVAAPSDRVPRRWAARRPASCRGGSALIAALGAGCRARCPSAGTLSQRVGGRSTIRTSRHHKSDHSLMSAAPGRDLVQLWLGPRPCSPRSPAGSTISVECAVCGVDVPTSWNVRPSAGITSRRMGPESIQRAPRPTCGNTEPRAASPARPKPDRPLAVDLRRPWEQPERLTPARVRRGFRHLHTKRACTARAPKPHPATPTSNLPAATTSTSLPPAKPANRNPGSRTGQRSS